MNAHIMAGFVKIGGSEHISMIGDSRGGHTEILGPSAQILNTNGSIQEAVFGMAVQVNKIGHEKVPVTKFVVMLMWRV